MATYSSKQTKGYNLADPIFVLLCIVLISMLVIPLIGALYNSDGNPLRSPGRAGVVSNSGNVSFASDLQYWNANCSHGWSTDAACDVIVSRAQSCSVSVESAYCSEYDRFMGQLRDR